MGLLEFNIKKPLFNGIKRKMIILCANVWKILFQIWTGNVRVGLKGECLDVAQSIPG